MLTESVSDPRRANWLTITSMSEDVCWPEEPSTSRPNWELEAEILRLTTRLMMRERELRQVKSQLKAQSAKLQQQNAAWRRRMEEKEEQVKELLVQKDAEMQNIVSQLLLFEAELRREQARIEDLLGEKDAHIVSQQKEIDRLRRSADDKNSAAISGDSAFSSLDISDSKDRRDVRVHEDAMTSDSQHAVHKHKDGLATLRTSSLEISDRKDRLNGTRDVRVYEDAKSSDSQHTVQRLKDGLVKIRAIQDVTNVKSLDSEKKRVLYRPPQKMKDLKAKRINHKVHHRPVMGELTAQAIL